MIDEISFDWSDGYRRTRHHPLFSLIANSPMHGLTRSFEFSTGLSIATLWATAAAFWMLLAYIFFRVIDLRDPK